MIRWWPDFSKVICFSRTCTRNKAPQHAIFIATPYSCRRDDFDVGQLSATLKVLPSHYLFQSAATRMSISACKVIMITNGDGEAR